MTHKEKLNYLIENELVCNACPYQAEGCDGGVRGGSNGPIFPPCADGDYEALLDYDSIEEAFEKHYDEGE